MLAYALIHFPNSYVNLGSLNHFTNASFFYGNYSTATLRPPELYFKRDTNNYRIYTRTLVLKGNIYFDVLQGQGRSYSTPQTSF